VRALETSCATRYTGRKISYLSYILLFESTAKTLLYVGSVTSMVDEPFSSGCYFSVDDTKTVLLTLGRFSGSWRGLLTIGACARSDVCDQRKTFTNLVIHYNKGEFNLGRV
jgi:hypothetical protein